MKTVEFRSLIRYSPDKMQRNVIFSTDHVVTDICCFEPGQAQRSQKYPESDKVYFILEGTGRFSVGRTTREFKAGTAILVKSGEEHGIINMSEDRLLILSVVSPQPVLKT